MSIARTAPRKWTRQCPPAFLRHFVHVALLVSTILGSADGECDPGYHRDESSGDCSLCPQGTFKSENESFCTPCPNTGAFSPAGSNSSRFCVGGAPAAEACMGNLLSVHTPHSFWRPLETYTDLTWHVLPEGLSAQARYGHSAVSVEEFVIMFGGRVVEGVGYDAWGYDDDATHVLDAHLPRLTWMKALTEEPKPSARYFHSSVLHERSMVMYGGVSSSLQVNDLASPWVLDITTFRWQKVQTRGVAPFWGSAKTKSIRYGHSSVMSGDDMIVFGGTSVNSSSCLSDVWTLDVVEWTWKQQNDIGTSPPGLCWHSSVVYERRMIVFGGHLEEDALTPSANIWQLDIHNWNWTILSQSEGSPHAIRSAVWFQNELTVLSGACQARHGCELFVFDVRNHSWRSSSVQPLSSAAEEEEMDTYAVGGRAQRVVATATTLFALGGASLNGFSGYVIRPQQQSANELRGVSEVLFLSDRRRSSKPYPPTRERAAIAVVEDNLLLFGGMSTSFSQPGKVTIQHFRDTWRLDFRSSSWHSINVTGPPARHGHTMLSNGSAAILFGGAAGYVSADSWLPCRSCAASRRFEDRSYSTFNDVWVLDQAALNWTLLNIHASSAPPQREGHTAVLFNDSMVVVGGVDFSHARQADQITMFNDVWSLDLRSARWQAGALLNDGPGELFHHAAVTYGSQILVIGGCRVGTNGTLHFLNDVWALKSVRRGTWEWQRLLAVGAQSRRAGHSAMRLGSSIVVFGGYGVNEDSPECESTQWLECVQSFDDTWRITEDLLHGGQLWDWTKVEVLNPPNPRSHHMAAMTGPDYFVMGGGDAFVGADGYLWRRQFSDSASLPISTIVPPEVASQSGIYLALATDYMSVLLRDSILFSGTRMRAAHVLIEPWEVSARASVTVTQATRTLQCVSSDGCSHLAMRFLDFSTSNATEHNSTGSMVPLLMASGSGATVFVHDSTFTGIRCVGLGCSFTLEDEATGFLNGVIFRNVSSSVFGGSIAVLDAHLEVRSCVFNNSETGGVGGAIAALSVLHGRSNEKPETQSAVRIHNTTFASSSARQGGGALSCSEFAICTINASAFIDNQANGVSHGGAVLSKGDLVVASSVFESNSAGRGAGGAIFWQGQRPQFDVPDDRQICSIVDDSAALFGPCVASNAMRIVRSDGVERWEVAAQFPGLPLEPRLRIEVWDFYNQTVRLDDTEVMPAHVHIEDAAHAVLQGASSVLQATNSTEFEFWDLGLLVAYSSVEESQAIQAANDTMIHVLVEDFASGRMLRSAPIRVDFDSLAVCPRGHVLQLSTWNLTGVGGLQHTVMGGCKQCPEHRYTLHPLYGHDKNGSYVAGSPSCLICPHGAICSGGDALDGIGIWQSDGFEYVLSACPPGHARIVGDADRAHQHNKQECRRCRDDGVEYILDSNSSNVGCQKCPTGLMCFGDDRYVPRVNESHWAARGGVLFLRSCPAGYDLMNDTIASQRCEACDIGKQKLDTDNLCVPCPAGTFKPDKGTHPCTLCPTNTFLPDEGLDSVLECIPCPTASTTSQPGSTNSDDCQCDRSLYMAEPGGEQQCVDCPVGGRCLDGSCAFNSATSNCTDGTPVVGAWVQGPDGVFLLDACPEGHQIVKPSANDSQDLSALTLQWCQECCVHSQYILNQVGPCLPCPDFLICTGGRTVEPVVVNSTWVIDNDRYRLVGCPSGFYHSEPQDPLQSKCKPCEAGSECVNGNCTVCTPCPVGTYKGYPSTAECFPCPRGTYGTTEGAAYIENCTSCPYGAVTELDGRTDPSSCQCGSQFYLHVGTRETADAQVRCARCPAGAACEYGGCAFGSPNMSCPRGEALIGEWELGPDGSYLLMRCPDGYALVNSSSGTGVGTFVADDQECRRCDGYLLDPIQFKCQECPPGLHCYGNATVLARLNGSEWEPDDELYRLISCPAGHYAFRETPASQECVPCDAGTFCAQESCESCLQCPEGKYKNAIGTGRCLDCPANTYGPQLGAESVWQCTKCPVGGSTQGAGKASPLACACDAQLYRSYHIENGVNCNLCPYGAVCSDGSCGFQAEEDWCNTTGGIAGRWERDSVDDRFRLLSCPDGHMLVNSTLGNSKGDFSHDRQGCVPCERVLEYILRPNLDKCQPCPRGVRCYGNATLEPIYEDWQWSHQLDNDNYLRYVLSDCPQGHQISGARAEALECVPCAIGTECTRDRCTNCSLCQPGFYKDASGAHACTPCPISTYGPQEGATDLAQCRSCPFDSSTEGVGNPNIEDCICPQQYYVSAPPGAGGESDRRCKTCPLGGLCADGSCGLRFHNASCPGKSLAGTWQYGEDGVFRLVQCPNATSLVNTSHGTSQGDFFHDGQRCQPCDTIHNYIINPNTDMCQQCPPGLQCNGGREVVPVVESNWRADNDLYYLVNCTRGFLPVRGNENFSAELQKCLPCPKGQECTETWCAGCSDCKPGTYKPSEGTGACTECPVGSYNPIQGARSLSDCLSCPADSTTHETGRRSVSDCVCALGTYRREYADHLPSCVACPKGATCDDGNCALNPSSASNCVGMDKLVGSWVRNDTEYFSLMRCPAGYSLINTIQSGAERVFDHDGQHCRQCRPLLEYVVNPNTNACQPCPKGLECLSPSPQSLIVTNESALPPIVDGILSARRGILPTVNGSKWIIAGDRWILHSCPTGYRVRNETYETQHCDVCSKGKQCVQERCVECSSCPVGTYKETEGSYQCRDCPLGTYLDTEGAINISECVQCPPGAVTNRTGAITASQCFCTSSDYKAQTAEPFECLPCPVGAICGLSVGVCALNFDPPECEGQPIVGNWSRQLSGEFVLSSCPEGYSRVVSNPDSEGRFVSAAQQCHACYEHEYIIDPNRFGCQQCPPGLSCNGSSGVKRVVERSEWEIDGPVFRLRSCPRGFSLFNETVERQECQPCGFGQECEQDVCYECAPCSEGRFKDTISTDSCSVCAVGAYAPIEGSTRCTLCPAFSSTSSVESVARVSCECDGLTYAAGGPEDFVCAGCPLGGVCPGAWCAMATSNLSCSDGSVVTGSWQRNSETGLFHLTSCPEGHSLINSTSGTSEGVFFHDGQQCARCSPLGQYVINPNTDACQDCPPGLHCPSGTDVVLPKWNESVWEADGDIYRLKSCPSGYFAYAGAAGFEPSLQTCLPCPEGTECTLQNCTECSPCQAGMYKDFTGPLPCLPCPNNTFGRNAGATALGMCTLCPDGAVTDGDAQPDPSACICEPRLYLVDDPALGVSCRSCPEGAKCPGGECALALNNFTCSDGTTIVGLWTRGVEDQFVVSNCPDGHELINSISGSSGPFLHDIQQCRPCLESQYVISEAAGCQECPIGLSCRGVRAVEPVNSGAIWNVVSGRYSLSWCPPGYYREQTSFRIQRCVPCEAGNHCPAERCRNCEPCPPGRYKDSAGSYNCQLCPRSTYHNNFGARSASECISCPSGAFSVAEGQTNISACQCQKELYTVGGHLDSEAEMECITCPVGAVCLDGSCSLGNPNHTCSNGEQIVGEWMRSPQSGRYMLTACPAGHSLVNTTTGGSVGVFSHDAQSCVPCHVLDEYVVNPDTDHCQPCPPGLTCDGTHSVSPKQIGSEWELCDDCEESGSVYVLQTCPPGHFVVNVSLAQQRCQPCGLGTECLLEDCTVCTKCSPGYYKTSAGPVACQPCPLNTYNPDWGATSVAQCSQCLMYGYTERTGSTSPAQCLCQSGTYSSTPTNGPRACLLCPIGATCADASCAFEREPAICLDGVLPLGNWTRSPRTDSFVLQHCPDGYSLANSADGTSSGTFSHELQRCRECSSQQYILRPDVDACQPCPRGLHCNGTRYVEPRLGGSTWVQNGAVYKLQSCATGHFVFAGNSDFVAAQQDCFPCDLGFECIDTACVRCSQCAAGKYKDVASPEPCEPCPVNTFGNTTGATAVETCTACPVGAVTQGTGHSDLEACACLSHLYPAESQTRALQSCVTCPDGAVCSDATCGLNSEQVMCSDGHLVGAWRRNPADGKYLLHSCPDGYRLVNSTESSSSGTFAHDLQRCQKCSPSTYIIDDMSECKQCQEGILCNGAKDVIPLVQGAEYLPVGDTYWLASCPTGYSRHGFVSSALSSASNSDILQQNCFPCAIGEQCTSERCIQCKSCPQGTYKDEQSPAPCQSCPLNTFGVINGSTSRTDCVACPSGAVTLNLGETAAEACICDPATYRTTEAVGLNAISCSACPQGALCADGTCAMRNLNLSCADSGVIIGDWETNDVGVYFLKSCPGGYSLKNESGDRFVYVSQRCERCQTTEYILNPNTQDCQACPKGLRCQGDDVVVERVPNSVWELVDGFYYLRTCPDGYLIETTTPTTQQCADCPVGHQCTTNPCEECTPCEPGYYKDTTGPGSCEACDRDTYNPIYGATSSTECVPCPRFASTKSRASTRRNQCTCAQSTYIMDEQFENTTGAWCMECPIGGECQNTTQDICALRMPGFTCPNGETIVGNWSRVSLGGEFRLRSCPSGYSMVNALDGTSSGEFWHGAQQCEKCEPGRHYILDPNRDSCQLCPPGLICHGDEQVDSVTNGSMWFVNESIYWLAWCPSGHRVYDGDETDFEAQSQECRPCLQGEVCHDDRCRECTACPAGTYKDQRGDGVCQLCPNHTFSAEIGAVSVGQCRQCPTYSRTEGPGQVDVDACICDLGRYKVMTPGQEPRCVFCPVGAMCPDGRTCAVNLDNFSCPTSGRITGEWGRNADDFFVLLRCPSATSMLNSTTGTSSGVFSHDLQQCVRCKTCPDGQEWCSTAEYVIDPRWYKCKQCPYGAECNGSQLRTVDSLDVLGARWRPNIVGQYWIILCPVGYRLMNHTGYENQHCKACPAGQYVFRPNHPRFECHPCPAGATCLNGGPPIFGTEAVSSFIVIQGMVDTPSDFSSRENAIMTASLEASIPSVPGSVEITDICDANGANCKSDSTELRRSGLLSNEMGRRTLLQSGSSGISVNFRVLSDSLAPSELQSTLARSDFVSSLGSSIMAIDPTLEVTIPELDPPKLDAPPNSKGERYRIDSDGRALLWYCGNGYLLVNDTFSLQHCADCYQTTYSLHPLDYCTADGTCAIRDCSRCPRGARCDGGTHFEALGGSTWEILYSNDVLALVYRLMSCVEGQLLVRIPELPAEDQCLECPSGSYALEATNINKTYMRPGKGESVVGPLLCFSCPRGATCAGRLDVQAADGFWRGKDMICPNSKCDALGVCNPKDCELTGQRDSGEDGEELWRVRALVFPCRPRHCALEVVGNQTRRRSDNGTNETGPPLVVNQCRDGHRGLLCGECESGWTMTGATCRYCGRTGVDNEGFGGIVVFAVIALAAFSYFAAWRPLLQEYEDRLLELCFPPKDEHRDKSWWERLTLGVHASLTDYLKVLVSFFQVSGNFLLKVNVLWPQDLLDYFLTVASAVQLDIFTFPGLSCVFDLLSYRERLQLMSLAVPMIIAFLGIPSFYTRYHARHRQNACTNHFLYCSLFFLFITYHFTSRLVFEAFACVNLGVDGEWLKADIATICPASDSNKTTYVWAIFCVVLYPVGTPLLMYGILLYFEVNKSVENKMKRSYMLATLDKFKMQNAVPLLIAKRLNSQIRDNDSELKSRVQEVKVRKIHSLQEDGEDASDLINDKSEFHLGVDDLRELLAGLKIKDTVPHSELQGMIDRYGSQGTMVRDELIGMVNQVLQTQDVLTGNEDPDDLSQLQLRKLCYSGQFETAHYHGSSTGSKRDTYKRQHREDPNSAGKLSYSSQSRDELVSLLVRRAKSMEAKGELDIPEPTWDGASKNERLAIDRVGFLFNTYRCRFWWFEIFDLCRKILMGATGIFVFEGTPSQLAVGLLITMMYLILALTTKPFLNDTIGNMHLYSLFVQSITYFYGIVLATGELDELAGEDDVQRDSMAQFILVINVLILVFPIIDRILGLRPSLAQIRRFLINPVGVPESWFGIQEEGVPPKKQEREIVVQSFAYDEFIDVIMALRTFLRMRTKQAGHNFDENPFQEEQLREADGKPAKKDTLKEKATAREAETLTSPRLFEGTHHYDSAGALHGAIDTMHSLDVAKQHEEPGYYPIGTEPPRMPPPVARASSGGILRLADGGLVTESGVAVHDFAQPATSGGMQRTPPPSARGMRMTPPPSARDIMATPQASAREWHKDSSQPPYEAGQMRPAGATFSEALEMVKGGSLESVEVSSGSQLKKFTISVDPPESRPTAGSHQPLVSPRQRSAVPLSSRSHTEQGFAADVPFSARGAAVPGTEVWLENVNTAWDMEPGASVERPVLQRDNLPISEPVATSKGRDMPTQTEVDVACQTDFDTVKSEPDDLATEIPIDSEAEGDEVRPRSRGVVDEIEEEESGPDENLHLREVTFISDDEVGKRKAGMAIVKTYSGRLLKKAVEESNEVELPDPAKKGWTFFSSSKGTNSRWNMTNKKGRSPEKKRPPWPAHDGDSASSEEDVSSAAETATNTTAQTRTVKDLHSGKETLVSLQAPEVPPEKEPSHLELSFYSPISRINVPEDEIRDIHDTGLRALQEVRGPVVLDAQLVHANEPTPPPPSRNSRDENEGAAGAWC